MLDRKRERPSENLEERSGARKKTRRGKRGGQHRHPKVTKHVNSNRYPPSDTHQLPPKDSSVLTVGERLLSHTLRNGLLDAVFYQDGYESQEEGRAITDECLPFADPPFSSRKRRKRKFSRSHEKQSGDSSLSSAGNLDLNLAAGGDSGLRYHLEMRTMRTEASFLSLINIPHLPTAYRSS